MKFFSIEVYNSPLTSPDEKPFTVQINLNHIVYFREDDDGSVFIKMLTGGDFHIKSNQHKYIFYQAIMEAQS